MEENKFKFDITPHIVKQLGEQLVPDEVTALLELIKNSYDADASYVSIEINTTGFYDEEILIYPSYNGYISVEDDGFGMNQETILESWLVISNSKKRKFKEEKQKTKKGRTPLGDKGLGRLSTQRLANKCELLTKKSNEQGVHLAFDWKDFDTVGKLSEVMIKSKPYNLKKNKGTILVLSDLTSHNVWEGKNLEKFKGQVSQLISPYKENRPFEVYLKIDGVTVDLEKSNENLRSLALSSFEFKFNFDSSENEYILSIIGKTKLSKFRGNKTDEYLAYLATDNGNKFFSFLNRKYKHIRKSNSQDYFIEFSNNFSFNKDILGLEKINNEFANPGSFSGVIDEFGYDNWLGKEESVISKFGKISNYRAFAQNQAGIKIYRNGFAVLPYGINKNDWLHLADSQTHGSSYYPLRPANVLGFFSIDEAINSNLKEKTDRQGFVSNSYSNNFITLSHFIVDEINRYQENIRRAYNDFLKEYKTENNGIKTTKESFDKLKELKNETLNVSRKDVENAETILKTTLEEQNKIVDEVENNSLFASEENKKEYSKAKTLLDKLKNVQDNFTKLRNILDKSQKIEEVINILEPKIEILEEQINDFSELAALGLTAESISHEFSNIADNLAEKVNFYSKKLNQNKLSNSDNYMLIEYISSTVNSLKVQLKHLDPALKYNREKKSIFSLQSFFEVEQKYYNNRFKKSNISLEIITNQNFNIEINKGKLTQIIDNILINSEYWLKQKLNQVNFSPVITIKIESPWIYISDNGYGIQPSLENLLFEPFVTTKPKNEGRGLGLFIVHQLIDSINCDIALDSERNSEGRKYIFAINLANVIKN